ncbi:hypothetical protein BDR26DRAFT_386350 [Obelidium mucronatum]|nr:hypothetical protein BDR26DRAFT_386350 [Obelidium mucronatum]
MEPALKLKRMPSVASSLGSGSGGSDSDDDAFAAQQLEKRLFGAVNEGDVAALRRLFSVDCEADANDKVLQLLLTTTYPNTDGFYTHDQDVIPDALELLGQSLEHLNAIQIACILGDEESALEILDFVAKETEEIGARKVLYEFMGRVWGDGNTVLHMASFLGMPELVKRLLELGANPNKKNGRQYRPVDCADTDETRIVFNTVSELVRGSGNQPNYISDKIQEFLLIENRASISSTRASFGSVASENSSRETSKTNRSFSNPKMPNQTIPHHSKAKSMDERMLTDMIRTKGILSSRPSSQSFTSEADLGQSPPSNRKHPKKRVSFSPETILLDVCQHGKDVDANPIETIKQYLSSLTTTTTTTATIPNQPILNINSAILKPFTPIAEIQSPQQSLTLLHLASAYGHTEIVRELLQRDDVCVNARDREGWTPLHCACAEGHLDVIRELCSAIGWIAEDGEKYSAVTNDDDISSGIRCSYWPIDGPIDLDALNGDGDTADMVALEERKDEIGKMLKDSRAALGYELIREETHVLTILNPNASELEVQRSSVAIECAIVQETSLPISPPESVMEPCVDSIVENLMTDVSASTPQPIAPDETQFESFIQPSVCGDQLIESTHMSQSPPTSPQRTEEAKIEVKEAAIFSSLSADKKEESHNSIAEIPPEPARSPKPIRGTAAKLIAAFNQKSSDIVVRSSLGTTPITTCSTDRLTCSLKIPRRQTYDNNPLKPIYGSQPAITTFTKSPIPRRSTTTSATDTSGAGGILSAVSIESIPASPSTIHSISSRRKSLLQQQIQPIEARYSNISRSGSTPRASECTGSGSLSACLVENSSTQSLSPLPANLASSSWSSLSPSKKEESAKKKKAHRLSETTSGYFLNWMGVSTTEGKNVPLKSGINSVRNSVSIGEKANSSEQTLG